MKRMVLILALLLAGCSTSTTSVRGPKVAEWALITDGTCYSFRVRDKVSPTCFKLLRKAKARMEQVKSHYGRWLHYEQGKWEEL